MNRQQRRALRGRADPVAELEATRLTKELELADQAREICAWIRTSTEPLTERRDLVAEAIRDMAANPVTALFVGPALAELRQLHAELSARAEAH